MNRIASIALNTFRESVRGKLLYLVIVFGGILVFSTYLLSPLSVGAAREKIVTDIGLAFISFIGVMTAVMVGSTLVHKEVDKKAVYMVLTRPVSRFEYLAGKFFGIMAALLVMICVMSLIMSAVIIMGGGGISAGILTALYFSILEMAVMSSVVIFFSTFTTPVLTFFFAACVFAAGNLSGDLRVFADKFGSETMKKMTDFIFYILPNLKVFNFRHQAVHEVAVSFSELGLATFYALAYCVAVMLFAYLVFNRREFA